MKRLTLTITLLCFTGSLFAQEKEQPPAVPAPIAQQAAAPIEKTAPQRCNSEPPGYMTRDTTAISMMGWGLLLAIGIATFCSLTEKNATKDAN